MRGFTLIELLVVVAIMGLFGTLGFINYRTFKATQVLNEGVSLVQSLMRVAQSNATAGLKCGGLGGATWQVSLSSNTVVNLNCMVGAAVPTLYRAYSLPAKVQVSTINSCLVDPCTGCNGLLPFTVNFSPLFAEISFADNFGTACVPNQSTFYIKLIHTQTNEVKFVSASLGGAIDAQK